jgi:hypothetical protein
MTIFGRPAPDDPLWKVVRDSAQGIAADTFIPPPKMP